MSLENLGEMEIIHGFSTLIFFVISMLIGIKIIAKCLALKKLEFLTVGTTWIFLTSSWLGTVVSFVIYILLNVRISEFLFLFLENAFVPLALISWISSFFHLTYKKYENIALLCSISLLSVYEIAFITLLLTDTKNIGVVSGITYWYASIFTMVFQSIALSVTIITGIIFGLKTMQLKSDPKFKIKGIFLLAAWMTFFIGGMVEVLVSLDIIALVLVRLLYISSGVEIYLGFFLPDKIYKMFSKI